MIKLIKHNGLPRFARNNKPFTVHHSQFTQLAFTLAETLIVIGILGVVAALTLPNLNHATGDKETVTRLKKVHSTLNEAFDRAIATYGPLDEWQNTCGNTSEELAACTFKRITEFLKVSKTCSNGDYDEETGDLDTANMESCTTSLDGWTDPYQSAAVLADGTTFIVYDFYNPSCDENRWQYKNICIDYIEVDINGKNKGKNQYGQDQFEFMVTKDSGIVPFIHFRNNTYAGVVSDCMSGKNFQCTFWVLEYENMDYLKADNSGKCTDNPSITLDGVTNTSCH